MEVKDIFIAPIYIILLSLLAYLARPMVTNAKTRKYFLPGLWAKMLGAVAVGMIYQFYYDGGDTFNYFTNGSRWIWEAFLADPVSGFKLLMESGGSRHMDTFAYSQHIWYYRDPNSYFVVRLTAFFDLFTFHTYAATALLFASFSFSGMWAFFMALVNRYPAHVKWIAVAVLFIPSTLFWGSGIMKDTLTLGALGWLTFGMIKIIEEKKRTFFYWIVVTLSIGLIYEIKPYILICYLPLIFVWLYWKNILTIRNKVTRVFIAPVLLALFGFMAYGVMKQISGETQKYSLENIAEQAMITSYDIRYGWGARMGGDGGYDLGVLDGTWQSMIRLLPAAVNVSLFRPYLWEVRNPLMLLAALESTVVIFLTFWAFFYKKRFFSLFRDPFLVFCLAFALIFAFAVGVSTYNFGTLMRYKIPMYPFYLILLLPIRENKLVGK